MIVPVENITDGMILEAPLINCYGQTLLSSGIELSRKHIRLLKTWNIIIVSVKSYGSEEEPVEINPELYNLAEEKLLKRFVWLPRNDFERELYLLGIHHTINKYFKNMPV